MVNSASSASFPDWRQQIPSVRGNGISGAFDWIGRGTPGDSVPIEIHGCTGVDVDRRPGGTTSVVHGITLADRGRQRGGSAAVSTAPMGPGWWQASDGRWYPPEQHPTWAPAPPAAAAMPPSGLVGAQPGGASVDRPRRSRAIPAIAVLVLVLAGAGAVVYLRTTTHGSNAFAAEPADQIAAAAQSAARAAGSVAIVNRATASTGSRTTESQASTAATGSQHFVSGTARFQNRCIPGACYVEGNEAGLEEAFKMPATLAIAHAGRWLALQATSGTATELRQYRAVFTSTTLPSLLGSALVPSGLQAEGTTTVDGQTVVGLHGTRSAGSHGGRESGTWYVRVAAPHLLLKAIGTAATTAGTAKVSSTYTAWGSTKAVTAPPTSIPFPITYEK